MYVKGCPQSIGGSLFYDRMQMSNRSLRGWSGTAQMVSRSLRGRSDIAQMGNRSLRGRSDTAQMGNRNLRGRSGTAQMGNRSLRERSGAAQMGSRSLREQLSIIHYQLSIILYHFPLKKLSLSHYEHKTNGPAKKQTDLHGTRCLGHHSPHPHAGKQTAPLTGILLGVCH